MNTDQMSRLKIEILKIAKEMLINGSDPTDLYYIQDSLSSIDANEDGIDFCDNESYTIDQIMTMSFEG